VKIKTEVTKVPVLLKRDLTRIERLVTKIEHTATLLSLADKLRHEFGIEAGRLSAAIASATTKPEPRAAHPVMIASAHRPPVLPPAQKIVPGPDDFGSFRGVDVHARLIAALHWWRVAGVLQPTRVQVAFVAGYTLNGYVVKAFGSLASAGTISYPGPGLIQLDPRIPTPGDTPLATRDVLIGRVRGVLGEHTVERKLFDVLVKADAALDRETLARQAGYTLNGYVIKGIGRLSSLHLVRYPQRGMVALGSMFEAIA
jgi:hypothetical protein